MLEPASKEDDPYRRSRQEGQPPITDDPEVKDAYEIERLLDRRVIPVKGRKDSTGRAHSRIEFLVR